MLLIPFNPYDQLYNVLGTVTKTSEARMLTEKKVVQCTKCLHNFHVKVPFSLKSLNSYHIELCLLCQKGPLSRLKNEPCNLSFKFLILKTDATIYPCCLFRLITCSIMSLLYQPCVLILVDVQTINSLTRNSSTHPSAQIIR